MPPLDDNEVRCLRVVLGMASDSFETGQYGDSHEYALSKIEALVDQLEVDGTAPPKKLGSRLIQLS